MVAHRNKLIGTLISIIAHKEREIGRQRQKLGRKKREIECVQSTLRSLEAEHHNMAAVQASAIKIQKVWRNRRESEMGRKATVACTVIRLSEKRIETQRGGAEQEAVAHHAGTVKFGNRNVHSEADDGSRRECAELLQARVHRRPQVCIPQVQLLSIINDNDSDVSSSCHETEDSNQCAT